mmetsp:Transcript_96674/g.155948  ORF Transcript_96674/g.155948 Transcript_96674/m.155948 type:complete len:273 (+) Transcript_96674:662-1480(+)
MCSPSSMFSSSQYSMLLLHSMRPRCPRSPCSSMEAVTVSTSTETVWPITLLAADMLPTRSTSSNLSRSSTCNSQFISKYSMFLRCLLSPWPLSTCPCRSNSTPQCSSPLCTDIKCSLCNTNSTQAPGPSKHKDANVRTANNMPTFDFRQFLMSRPSLLRDGICTKRRAADIGTFNVGEHLKLDIDRLRVLEWLLVLQLRCYFPCISICVCVFVFVCVFVCACILQCLSVYVQTHTFACMNTSNTLSSPFLLIYPADTQFITVDSHQNLASHN